MGDIVFDGRNNISPLTIIGIVMGIILCAAFPPVGLAILAGSGMLQARRCKAKKSATALAYAAALEAEERTTILAWKACR